ncbi:MAG: PspA/IM30 family protein [Sulfobacillus sp.]
MGLLARMSTVFKSKASAALDQMEDPRQTLDYSYQKQMELLQQVKRSLADVATSKKLLELQKDQLDAQVTKLESEAQAALSAGREDLAREALTRKAAIAQQSSGLTSQVADLAAQEEKMVESEKRLEAKITSFRSQKEVIKAQYSTAEAQVKVGEATTGISEEMADVGMAMQRAQDKTDRMKARAAAIDDLTESGALTDPTAPDPVQAELDKVQQQSDVDADLARLKAQMGGAK